jgi:hypothetical protein
MYQAIGSDSRFLLQNFRRVVVERSDKKKLAGRTGLFAPMPRAKYRVDQKIFGQVISE